MRILIQFITINCALSLILRSGTRQYDVCKTLSGGESPSDVYLAVMTPRGVMHPAKKALCDTLDRTNEALVVVKCEKPNAEDENLENEIVRSQTLSGAPWAVEFIEEFSRPRGAGIDRCYSMKSLGRSIREIREKSVRQFDLPILAAMGAQMVGILKSLHNDFGLHHTDVHAANWLVRIDNPTQMALIDYGYMASLSSPLDRIRELQEMVITLRWYTDLNEDLYVPKKILRLFGEINIDAICPPERVPGELKAIIQHVFSLDPETFDPETEYDLIQSMFVSLLEDPSSIAIPWRDPKHIKWARFVPVVPSVAFEEMGGLVAAAASSSNSTIRPTNPAVVVGGDASVNSAASDSSQEATRAALRSIGLGFY